MDELSKVKRDLESALKDVLQAMRITQQTTPSDAAINIPSLERLANVSVSHASTEGRFVLMCVNNINVFNLTAF